LLWLSIVVVAMLFAWWAWKWRQRKRTARLLISPLPAHWQAILERRVPIYRQLPAELKKSLHGRVQLFLDNKVFIGCNGQEINDDVRLTIAGNACLLVIARSPPVFPDFETILVYPDTYVVAETSYDGLVETHGESIRLGESWHRGPVVLSWADVLHGSENPFDGHNVVIHEFAHKLDEENAVMDGLPVLRQRADYADWAKVLTEEFAAFRERVKYNENSVIDEYGAVSAAEFFAVISETFFEKPSQMKSRLPRLYQQLATYYGLDPAAWRD
jgi:MtfA peptidase